MSGSGATSKATLCAQALHNDRPGALCWRPQNLRHFKLGTSCATRAKSSRRPFKCIFLSIYHVYFRVFLCSLVASKKKDETG